MDAVHLGGGVGGKEDRQGRTAEKGEDVVRPKIEGRAMSKCNVVPVLVAGCSGLLQPTVGRDSGCQPHPHSHTRTNDSTTGVTSGNCHSVRP
jgi:hypothetical protein